MFKASEMNLLAVTNQIGTQNMNLSSMVAIGEEYYSEGKIENAIDQFKRVLSIEPKDAVSLLDLGVCYSAVGDYETAEMYIKQSILYSPLNYEARSSLSSIYMLTNRCKSCGSTKVRNRFEVNGHYGKCVISSCIDCNIFFLRDNYEPHAHQIIVNSDVRNMAAGLCTRLNKGISGDLYQAYEDMSTDSFKYLSDLIKSQKPSGKVLDVGCGNGYFLTFFDNSNWQTTGIDYNKDNQRHASVKGLDVLNINFKDFEPPYNFDVITMIEFIEHSPLPQYDIEYANKLLNKKGLLMIVTGNVESDEAKNMGKNWAYFSAAPDHKYFFAPNTLSAMFEAVGFVNIQVLTSCNEEKLIVLGTKS